MENLQLTERAKKILSDSILTFNDMDQRRREEGIQHIKRMLRNHKNGVQYFGMGADEDFVLAGKEFLRLYS